MGHDVGKWHYGLLNHLGYGVAMTNEWAEASPRSRICDQNPCLALKYDWKVMCRGRQVRGRPTAISDPNRLVFNDPVGFTDPSGKILPLLLLVGAGALAGWYLLGPGASTAQAPRSPAGKTRPLTRRHDTTEDPRRTTSTPIAIGGPLVIWICGRIALYILSR